MEKPRNEESAPKTGKQEEDFCFDESVCSAEFTQGCTLPVSEQLDQP